MSRATRFSGFDTQLADDLGQRQTTIPRRGFTPRLHSLFAALLSGAMKFWLALLVWLAMAVILIKGILMAVAGQSWLLWVGLIGFTALVAKIGCLAHD